MRMPLAVLAAAALFGPALASAAEYGPGEAQVHAIPAGERSGDTWTTEAMENAAPLAIPEVDPAAVRRLGRERGALGGAPSLADPVDEAAADDGDANERGSGNVHKVPLHWSGRLFGKKPNGNNYSCSAQFVSNSVLITAAHCVQDMKTGDFYRNVVFALEYRKGKYHKLYRASCLLTYAAWAKGGETRWLYDYAFIRVGGRSATGHWGSHFGWLGAYNKGTKTGYPSGIQNGEIIQVQSGPINVTDGIAEMKYDNTANPQGSSGGAWIAKYAPKVGKNNYVISVSSFFYPGAPEVIYGPYLDSGARELAKSAESGCD